MAQIYSGFYIRSHSRSLPKRPCTTSHIMWPHVITNTLVMRCCGLECKHLHRLRQQPRRCLLGLRTLDISVNPRISVCVLMRHNFPQLNILILRKCELNAKDLSSLAQASNLGRLLELRHLDLSLNDIG